MVVDSLNPLCDTHECFQVSPFLFPTRYIILVIYARYPSDGEGLWRMKRTEEGIVSNER